MPLPSYLFSQAPLLTNCYTGSPSGRHCWWTRKRQVLCLLQAVSFHVWALVWIWLPFLLQIQPPSSPALEGKQLSHLTLFYLFCFSSTNTLITCALCLNTFCWTALFESWFPAVFLTVFWQTNRHVMTRLILLFLKQPHFILEILYEYLQDHLPSSCWRLWDLFSQLAWWVVILLHP